MAQPFEDEQAQYLALVNEEGQYSVWPALVEVPAGWRVELPAAPRRAVLDHVERRWPDQRPARLRGGEPGQ